MGKDGILSKLIGVCLLFFTIVCLGPVTTPATFPTDHTPEFFQDQQIHAQEFPHPDLHLSDSYTFETEEEKEKSDFPVTGLAQSPLRFVEPNLLLWTSSELKPSALLSIPLYIKHHCLKIRCV